MARETEVQLSVWVYEPPRIIDTGTVSAFRFDNCVLFFSEGHSNDETTRLEKLMALRDAIAAHITEITPPPVVIEPRPPLDAA